MTWIERPTASLTYTMIDETGSHATFSLDVPQGTLADVAITAAGVLRPLVQALTGCTILSYGLAYSSFDDAPAAPLAQSRIEQKGVFTFRTAAGKTVTYQVPGILPVLVDPTGRIDDDNVAVLAFTSALTAVDALFCDSNGVDLSSLKEAYERFRRSTRKMLPSNRQPD